MALNPPPLWSSRVIRSGAPVRGGLIHRDWCMVVSDLRAHRGLGPEIVPKDLLGPDVLSHAYSTLRGVCAASDPSLMRHKASAALEAPTAAPQRLPFLFRRLQ